MTYLSLFGSCLFGASQKQIHVYLQLKRLVTSESTDNNKAAEHKGDEKCKLRAANNSSDAGYHLNRISEKDE